VARRAQRRAGPYDYSHWAFGALALDVFCDHGTHDFADRSAIAVF